MDKPTQCREVPWGGYFNEGDVVEVRRGKCCGIFAESEIHGCELDEDHAKGHRCYCGLEWSHEPSPREPGDFKMVRECPEVPWNGIWIEVQSPEARRGYCRGILAEDEHHACELDEGHAKGHRCYCGLEWSHTVVGPRPVVVRRL